MVEKTSTESVIARASVHRRLGAIYKLLESGARLQVEDLARRFQVSIVTIRRDLRHLEKTGKLIRTRGGAAPVSAPPGAEFSFVEKLSRAGPEKEAIGRAAAALVSSGESVILDSGSTAYLAARLLRAVGGLTVVTNSIPVLLTLVSAEGVEVVVPGGILSRTSAELTGPAMRRGLEGVRARLALLGADGLTVDRGAQAASASVAEATRVLAEHAEQVVILADASKLGRDSFASYLEAGRISKVITAGELGEHGREECCRLGKLGVEVIVAEPEEPEGAG